MHSDRSLNTLIFPSSQGSDFQIRLLEIPKIQQVVDAWSETSPDSLAITTQEEKITYRELSQETDKLASALRELGAAQGARIGISMARGIDSIISMLAILKAGCICVPLDPSYPQERLKFITQDAGLTFTVTQDFLKMMRSMDTAGGITDDGFTGADDEAYILYTSGSTGTPKGVVLNHRGILDLALNADYAPDGPESRFLHASSISFDAAILEIWSALLRGRQLIVAPPGILTGPDLARLIEDMHLSEAFLTTALFHAIAEQDSNYFRGLRTLLVGGESLSADHAADVLRSNPGLRLINLYGPTEATVYKLLHIMDKPDDAGSPVPLGRPAPNAIVYILDEDLNPVEGAATGEIYIGGPGVSSGYLNRPDLTRKHFLPDPSFPHQSIYRTGDLAQWNPDGSVRFIGRSDEQIKIRGHRIEPGEIESALRRHPDIQQCVLIKHEEQPGSPHLAAYYTCRKGAEPSPGELRKFLAEHIPSFGIPAVFKQVESFTLTVNGKIDKEVMRRHTALDVRGEQRDTSDGIRNKIATIWREVIGIDSISGDVSFIEAGGNSLAAMRISHKLAQEFDVKVPLLTLHGGATVNDIASLVQESDPESRERISSHSGLSSAPATYGQRGLWFLQSCAPDNPVYNEVLGMRLSGNLDPHALAGTLTSIVERHHALRTGLRMHCGDLEQVIYPPYPVSLVERDLRPVEEGERQTVLEHHVRAFVRAPFDLSQPMFRTLLLRTQDCEWVLVLCAHHSVIDGWSADVIFNEMGVLYSALANGVAADLPTPELQLSDFGIWQRKLMSSGQLDKEISYWRQQLRGASPRLELPSDFPRPKQPTGAGALTCAWVPKETLDRIDALSRRAGTTRFSTVLAALQVLLSQYCDTEDVIVGTALSGRQLPETASAVGYFINMLPLRGKVDRSLSFLSFLCQSHSTVSEAYENQRVPFSVLMQELGMDLSEPSPYIQVCLVPEDVYQHQCTVDDIEARFEYFDAGISKFDLTISLVPCLDGRLGLSAEYRTDLFLQPTVDGFLQHFIDLLSAVCDDPESDLTRLTSMASRRQVVPGGTDGSQLLITTAAGIPDLVDQWALTSPNAVALTDGNTQLSYSDLTRYSNQIAHYLASIGVQGGSRVGVQMPRSMDTVAVFLGILKAGCSYVPLDPSYPSERLRYITEDAGLSFTLTPHLLATAQECIASQPACATGVQVTDKNPAYVIYTSGSTGRPKGVEILQSSVIDLVFGADFAQLSQAARHLHAASISFDMATFEIWAPLLHGARLVVGPATTMTADQFLSFTQQNDVSHAHLPTAVFHQYVEELPSCMAGLKNVVIGGEPLNSRSAAKALEANPGLVLVNGYGPTEATTYSTFLILRDIGDISDPLPIGRPTTNTRVRILDPHLQVVPPGVPGELFLGGPGLAAGYVGRPDLTQERFIPDPENRHLTLYRTGDLARWNTDGTIQYLGRIDNQVKVHGYRVETGEIESVLCRHPQIQHCVVVRREDTPGHPYLTAYYTSSVCREIDPREMIELASTALPTYMVPRTFVAMRKLPLTPGGKVDRAALPSPAAPAAPASLGSAGQSVDSIQTGLTEIWKNVLRADYIDPDDRLFDIGGASLHVAQIHGATAERFNVPGLRIIDIFTYSTIRKLSKYIEELQSTEVPLSDNPSSPEE
ncbi:amino acid adenylation domain-containing protein [Streptomyces sp. NPDC004787]|uniref:amino acid adenylation domain-containing protein n=1 Tax=Streptomyces sp. NPDC004787 TaxID=3154291 RepID=UPI0033BBECBD